MDTILSYVPSRKTNHFTVDYPYYGLFGTAEVNLLYEAGERLFECRLINGAVVCLKKLSAKKWIDTQHNSETPLSAVIGTYIDDFLKEQ
ncbi:MAG TPA: hypothetical protein VHK91_07185 [Flavisolibacter sp.]|jgi:hypothetical protein|nr:hypothetical protein [Flavisolibacter sp.]